MINTAYSDKMDLWQRTWNMMNYVVQYAAVKTIMSYQMDPIVHKYVDKQKESGLIGLLLFTQASVILSYNKYKFNFLSYRKTPQRDKK